MPTIISPVTCFAVNTDTLKGYIVTKNGQSASAGDSFTHGSDYLIYDFYTGTGNQVRTLRFADRKWVDENTGDQPVLYDGDPTNANSNVITQTAQNPQSFWLKWYQYSGSVSNSGTNGYYDSSWSPGPTVTSITNNTIFVPSDTIAVTDFTLKKDTTAYTATTSNLTLTGPTVYEGSRFYNYSISLDESGVYERTIDSKTYAEFEYDNSWESDVSGAASGRNTNSTRILNVLGSLPSNLTVNNVPSGFTKTAHTTRKIIYKKTGANAGSYEQYTGYVRGTSNDIKFRWIYFTLSNYTTTVYHEADYSIGAQENIVFAPFGAGVAGQINHTDWVYEDEPEGDGYTPTSSTNNNNGTPRDGYPIVMTNLFNRNRSIYSIGMTHKTARDPFI